jgi:hypothetical protein
LSSTLKVGQRPWPEMVQSCQAQVVHVPEPGYGSAFRGDRYTGMKPGAMLFLHQYLDNPTLIVIDGGQGSDLPEFVQD